MGLADAFGAEDRVQVKFSTFYELVNSLKTEIVVTANLREWRNIFKLRAVGVTGKPHPQMVEVMVPLLEEVKKQIPVVFDDLVTE